MPTVETERLRLKMFTPSYFEALYRLLSDPEVVKYVGNRQPVPRAETEKALASFGKHWDRYGFGRWAIIEKGTEEFVGFGGLRMLFEKPEIVYHLAKPFWGLGLATEMARAVLRYGFEEHDFEKIVAIAMPENKASIRVMEKIGMDYEGPANYYDIDVVEYAIFRENFRVDDSFYLLDED